MTITGWGVHLAFRADTIGLSLSVGLGCPDMQDLRFFSILTRYSYTGNPYLVNTFHINQNPIKKQKPRNPMSFAVIENGILERTHMNEIPIEGRQSKNPAIYFLNELI